MLCVNKVMLIGNVGSDPEVKYLEGNLSVAKFSVATNEFFKNKEGVRVEKTEWHNVVAWRGLAEIAEKYVRKGNQIYVEGKIRTRSYDDKDGVKKYYTEIVADTFSLLGKKGDDGNPASKDAINQSALETSAITATEPVNDLPF